MQKSNSMCLSMLTGFAITLLVTLTVHAGVLSYSAEQGVVVDGQAFGKKVVVTCHSGYGKQEILKKEGESQWCGAKINDTCSVKKAVAAELVCSRSYQRKIALEQIDSKENNQKERFARLREELLEIEQKRIDIAEKLLDLKRRELALTKKL